MPVPKHTLHFTVACRTNLGPLSTLALGHDNAGLTPKWLIECVYVRNDITGHIRKFPCGRWLGRGVDDESLERLLIAQPVSIAELQELTQVGDSTDNNNARYLKMMNRVNSDLRLSGHLLFGQNFPTPEFFYNT